MNRHLLSNSAFSAASWLLLFGATAAIAMTGFEIYNSHLRSAAGQQFNFGSAPTAARGGNVGLASTINSHLFGTVPVKVKPKVEKPKVVEAPETRLNLSLTGVVTAPDPKNSHAMIEIERGQTSVVRVGAEIGKTGAQLNAVFADHILIDHRGEIEKLAINRESLDLTNVSANNAQTISALNFNVAEFEALAAVDPRDIDISSLLPAPQPVQEQAPQEQTAGGDPVEGDQGSAVTGVDSETMQQQNDEALLAADRQKQIEDEQRQQEEEIRQQQLQQQQLQQQQLQQQQPNQVDSQGRPIRKNVPGGLKQI